MALDYSKFKASAEDDRKFDIAPFDIQVGRQKLNDRLARSLRQVNKEIPTKGGKDFDIGHNNQLRFRPTLNGQRIFVEKAGEDYFPISTAQFGPFITEFTRNVEAGHYDDQIEAALTGDGGSPAKPAKATAGKRTFSDQSRLNIRVGGFRRGGMDDAAIKAKLKAEGVSDAAIKAALDRKKG